MEYDPYRFHQKGMSPSEIDHLARVIVRAEENKEKRVKRVEGLAYGALLLVALVGSILLSFTFIPFIILLSNVHLYIVLILLGAAFGVMFSSAIKNLEVQLHHHTLILFLVPLVAFVSFFIITTMANATAAAYALRTAHSPAIVGILYITSFLLPYLNLLFTRYLHQHHTKGELYESA